MSTGTATTPAIRYVTCPKCLGSKYIAGFSHYAGGVCFQCSGNGTVEAATVAAAAPVANAVPHKLVACGRFGQAVVTRFGTGFRADFSYQDDGEARYGMVAFDVSGGRLVNVIVSDGPRVRGEGPEMVALLQSALKR